MSPHAEGGKKNQAPVTLRKQWKKGRDRGEENVPKESPCSGETLMLETLTKTPTKRYVQSPMEQEHEESWRMHIHNKPLTSRVKLVLLQ